MMKEQDLDEHQPQIQGKTFKGQIRFQIRLSDQIKHLYNPKTKMLDLELRAQYIHSATLYEKELDKPLGFFKKTIAFIAGMKTKHQFVVFELQSGLCGSVDFYIDNRVVVRLGNIGTIIEENGQGKRKDSVAVSKNQAPYMIDLKDKESGLTFGDLLKIIYEMAPEGGYNKLTNSGLIFSRQVMKEIKKQKKGKGSVIRFKLVDTAVGFDLI